MARCGSCDADVQPDAAMVEWLEGADDEGPREARVYCRHPAEGLTCARHIGKPDAHYVSFGSTEAMRVLANEPRRFPSRPPSRGSEGPNRS